MLIVYVARKALAEKLTVEWHLKEGAIQLTGCRYRNILGSMCKDPEAEGLALSRR